MTTTEKIAQERDKAHSMMDCLRTIEIANDQLNTLKHNAKDTESKELEIHLLWKRYSEL